jgi:hypothetical protein
MTVRFGTVNVNGPKVFYRSAGASSAPVVLLLHTAVTLLRNTRSARARRCDRRGRKVCRLSYALRSTCVCLGENLTNLPH